MSLHLRRRTAVVVVLVVSLSLACAPLARVTVTPAATSPAQAATQSPAAHTAVPTSSNGEASAVAPDASATPATDATAPAEVVVERTAVVGSGPFNLPDPHAGLAALSSYSATLTLTFDGTQDGAALTTVRTYQVLVSANPAARQLTYTASRGADSAAPVQLTSLAGVTYQQQGDGDCQATVDPADPTAVDPTELAAFLHTLIGADDAGADTANGLPAEHYTFDQRALDEDGLTRSTGAVWVAADGGYVVRYQLAQTAGPDYWGNGLEGTLTWDYELTDPNAPITIAAPAGCPPGLVDVPLPADAANVDSQPGLLTYDTAASPEDVVMFYAGELPPLGWATDGQVVWNETGGNAQFMRDIERLTVVVQTDGGGTHVTLLLRHGAS